jgi:ABC-type amino acid transport substrate-binding protein
MLGAMAGAAALLSLIPMGAAADVKTVEAGKLTIGMNGDMPMTQIKDGKLGGTDGELMVWVAQQIGLEPKPVQMDWAALIEATKQGKLDVMHGAMGWLEARTKIMILSEPI